MFSTRLGSICWSMFSIAGPAVIGHNPPAPIIESLTQLGWNTTLTSSPAISLTYWVPPLTISSSVTSIHLQYLHGWGLNHFPGQPNPNASSHSPPRNSSSCAIQTSSSPCETNPLHSVSWEKKCNILSGSCKQAMISLLSFLSSGLKFIQTKSPFLVFPLASLLFPAQTQHNITAGHCIHKLQSWSAN